MSPEKPMKCHGRPARRGLLFTRADTGRSLPPFFLTCKVRKSIEKLLPTEHHQRLRLYFDTYGCLHCRLKSVIYGGDGVFCRWLDVILRGVGKEEREIGGRVFRPTPKKQEVFFFPLNPPLPPPCDL